jgi:hypothetical protein
MAGKRPTGGADLSAVPSLPATRAAKKAAAAGPREFVHIEDALRANGSEREVLATVRLRLARLLDDPNLAPREVASNSRRLLEVDRSIRAIDAAAGGLGDTVGSATGTDDAPFDGSV